MMQLLTSLLVNMVCARPSIGHGVMSLVVHDPDIVGDVDPEGEARDKFHIEEMLNELTDEPPFWHDAHGDGYLYQKQTFFSGVTFKEAVVDYALRTGCNLKQYMYDQDKICFKCVGNDGKEEGVRCEWQVYAATLPNDPMWKIRKFIDKHNCIPNGECEMFKVPHIARLFVDKIRENPKFYMPAKIEELIKEQWKISVTRNQFARLRDYAAEILDANPDSHVEVDFLTNKEGKDMFNRFCVCFDNLRKTWMESCRPLLGIDGCFLKNTVKGQLLVALGRDANNKIYPVAWGVVKVENTENWVWFVKNLKEDLGLGDGEGYIMLSDRASDVCPTHIWELEEESLKQNKDEATLAWAYNEKDYKQNLEKIFYYDTVAREKPFLAMLETIKRLAMVRIAKRSVESHTHTWSCTPYVALVLSGEHKVASLAKVSTSTNEMYEVRHGLDSHRVCLKSYTCTCHKWQIRGIPCEHAYGVILDKKLSPEDYPETHTPAVFIPEPPEGEKKITKEDSRGRRVLMSLQLRRHQRTRNGSCIVAFVGQLITIQGNITRKLSLLNLNQVKAHSLKLDLDKASSTFSKIFFSIFI
ncbi:unnamed protein product [Arabidopsis arenosa]|uniref:SWIM-type domain-containing protein n=1 Tax=Arabidopsis arenosa TaxID=38785 RepID=A0A8S2A1L4_ARAAE|nr:unnamed protein product [Arabidopsis arenosa]